MRYLVYAENSSDTSSAIDVGAWGHELEALFRASDRAQGIGFTLAVDETLTLDADPDLMSQVLINLIRNAAQAARAHAGAPHVWLTMTRTRHGLAMRATAQDLEIAETQGIDTATTYRIAFLIAIFMTALAGGLYAQIYSLSPFMGDRPLLVAFVVVILGGMGSIPGAALGGIIFGFGESFLSTFYGSAVSSFASFGAVIALLILRPWGLLGVPE